VTVFITGLLPEDLEAVLEVGLSVSRLAGSTTVDFLTVSFSGLSCLFFAGIISTFSTGLEITGWAAAVDLAAGLVVAAGAGLALGAGAAGAAFFAGALGAGAGFLVAVTTGFLAGAAFAGAAFAVTLFTTAFLGAGFAAALDAAFLGAAFAGAAFLAGAGLAADFLAAGAGAFLATAFLAGTAFLVVLLATFFFVAMGISFFC
jgi:hypothetical protein